jgi:hypothetical protein
MGDRHKNFEDPGTWARDIRKTKFDLLGFFGPPFIYPSQNNFTLSFMVEEPTLFVIFHTFIVI